VGTQAVGREYAVADLPGLLVLAGTPSIECAAVEQVDPIACSGG